ncbi:c-type cytochrome [Flavobacterium franklandianum]|uniref:C-type cytochrome n=1 Tax=Flavobacterium franklandianum TaxID=2594430 RepID=A0A553C8C6_9FLAO|nr:c-type cytochrome [Flavobacterium franklandianum]TRX16755.1 c-type cytochrome [Flavobacterium franklandianum]TRX29665.1 c-type cytochrome [Flavobacterium franklandianum]
MKIKHLVITIVLVTLSSFTKFNSDKIYIATPIKSEVIVQQPSEGEKLIAKSDCIGCHNKDKKIVGPSYSEIAKKYPSNNKNINYLIDKVLSGGSGVWGPVPMLAHPTLKKEDAKSMVKYILSIKK